MNKKGGTAMDIGFGSTQRSKKGKGPSQDLVNRLSRQPDRSKAKVKTGRESMFKEVKNKPSDGSRTAVRVNPVTGKMTSVVAKKSAGGREMVREGSMYIPKEYLTAAAEAGLGNANGMYSHMTGLRRELKGGHNTGMTSGTSSSGSRKSAYQPIVKKFGGIHKLDTTSAPRRSNIKQVVQGRSRSITSGSGNKINDSSYTRQKGVINGLGGCSNTGSAARKSLTGSDRKTGIATLGSSGGRSFVKHDKSVGSKGGNPMRKQPMPSASSSTSSSGKEARRQSFQAKLGGGSKASSSSSGGGTNMSDREKRAAYFAQKFGKA